MKNLIYILCLSIVWFSCEKDVYGCTDSDACNFDPEANIYDPSTCYYAVDSNEECCAEEDLDDCGLCNGDNSTCTFSLSIQLLDDGLPVIDAETLISYIFSNPYGENLNSTPNQNVVRSDNIDELPVEYYLSHPFPNPFNPTTRVDYGIVDAGNIFLYVNDLEGNIVHTIVDAYQETGHHEETLFLNNSLDLAPTGINVFSIILEASDFTASQYAVLLTGVDFEQIKRFYTSNDTGTLFIDQKSWFPSLYALPEILATDSEGNALGYADGINNYVETQTLLVIFKHKGEYRSFDLNLHEYSNSFTFNWEDGIYFSP
tara:strand:- start:327 stop:1274 length:948 start_codon:yes stop_codon:yes gene_type:complete